MIVPEVHSNFSTVQDIRLNIPIIKAKLPSPGTLNTGFIILLKNIPKSLGILVLDKISVAIKKGSREGTTEFAHNFRPDFADCKLVLENNIKHIVNNNTKIEIIFFCILITNIRNFFN